MQSVKQGQKVRIRSWDSMLEEYRLIANEIHGPRDVFAQRMRKYCGETFICPEDLTESNRLRYPLFDSNCNIYPWMLEPAKELWERQDED